MNKPFESLLPDTSTLPYVRRYANMVRWIKKHRTPWRSIEEKKWKKVEECLCNNTVMIDDSLVSFADNLYSYSRINQYNQKSEIEFCFNSFRILISFHFDKDCLSNFLTTYVQNVIKIKSTCWKYSRSYHGSYFPPSALLKEFFSICSEKKVKY